MLVAWLAQTLQQQVCRETVRRALRRSGLTYKKATKVLTRACPQKRAQYLERLAPLLAQATRGERTLVFMDPAHIHQDCDLDYGWAPQGRRLLVASSSPGLSAKVTFYGIYVYNQASVRIWPYDKANAQNTMKVLERLANELKGQDVTLIWDGAAYHRAKTVVAKVHQLGWNLEPLSGYSPDFMPVEELWRWFRQEVTGNYVHQSEQELLTRAAAFESSINKNPYIIADRLVVLERSDPELEELRFSM